MANRTPVIASNTSSLPEVLDDAAMLVNPENVFDIARGMKLILSDDVLRQKLVQKGVEQVAKFSWKLAAQKVLETYQVAGLGRGKLRRLFKRRSGLEFLIFEVGHDGDPRTGRIDVRSRLTPCNAQHFANDA